MNTFNRSKVKWHIYYFRSLFINKHLLRISKLQFNKIFNEFYEYALRSKYHLSENTNTIKYQ